MKTLIAAVAVGEQTYWMHRSLSALLTLLRLYRCAVGNCLIVISALLPARVWAEEAMRVDGAELCGGTIDRVYFSGNEATQESVFFQELTIKEGDPCSLAEIEISRQNIMDLGIFSAVEPTLTRFTGRLVLQFTVKEKHYVLPIPRLSRTSDGEIRLGGQLRLDNFAGLNHQLKITSERHAEDDGAGRTGFEHSFEYLVPRIQNTRYGLAVKLKRMDKQYQLKRDGEIYGESNRIGDSVHVEVTRRKKKGAGSRGWQSRYRVRYELREHELREGELGPFEEGQNFELTAGLTRNELHLEKYRRHGYVYGGSVSMGLEVLGTDYNYQRFDAFYRGYRPLKAPTQTNVNYNFELGFTNGIPFGERAFSIGGGDSLRGLATRSVDGDVKFLFNIEYLQAVKNHPSLRLVGFWDIANVFPRGEFKPVSTENGVGVGLRWKIVSFVRIDLRFDYAVSLSEKKGYAYFGTQLIF